MIHFSAHIFLVFLSINVFGSLSAMDAEFASLNPTQAAVKGQQYKKQAEELAKNLTIPLENIPGSFSGNPTQIKLLGSKWKKEYERLKEEERKLLPSGGAVGSTNSSFVSPKPADTIPASLMTPNPSSSSAVTNQHLDQSVSEGSIPSFVSPQ